MSLATRLESFVRTNVPPWAARLGKRVINRPRYRTQLRAARETFRQFGANYPHPVLFVAGLPKSGTTWLESMLASFPGYQDVMIPEAVAYEQSHGGSHDYDIPSDMFDRLQHALVIAKMHVHGSPHNVDVLRKAGVPYLVMYRDLRDVAVSYVFYVRRTPWHPEHPHYRSLSPAQGLDRFADTMLMPYVDWVRSWNANRDIEKSMELRYEDLLASPGDRMMAVAAHFGLTPSPQALERIIEKNSFQKQSAGRAGEQQKDRSFFRKGVAGDWRNHLEGELKSTYKRALGTFLVEFGYEQDESW
jgi:hypothetical protein